ncbi:MAG: hypothetical protein ACP5QD_06800, partial [Candidatus Ratteibacteria bacterium]
LNIRCDEFEITVPFKFLTKDINFFAFPIEACLIYSSSDSRVNLRGSVEISEKIFKTEDITMTLTLKELSTGRVLFDRTINVLSNKFDVILPIEKLGSGGYELETSVRINPDNVLKNQYKFLKF